MNTKQLWDETIDRIQKLYLSDSVPWVVGYSGGKDSTAVVQLTWTAIGELPPERRHKQVHIISTDTLVEQPIVAAWVTRSLNRMNEQAKMQDLPIETHRLIPEIKDRYWVNLLGRGFAAPRQKFRWCTDRLKIKASNHFIQSMLSNHRETIVVLGTRKSESTARAKVMEKYEEGRIRDWLSPNGSLSNSWIFSPIEDWSQDDVWLFLMQNQNNWGHSNKDLLGMYRGATADGECPLVVNTDTPSCGNSRFGCWVCTLVSHDKSMAAMVHNDAEKEWLSPLLELRSEIARNVQGGKIHDYDVRDFRRTGGGIKLFRNTGMPIPGPYTREHRHFLLRRVLETHQLIREIAPDDMKDIEVIRMDELHEIRRIWVHDKHEWEDAVPRIYQEVFGVPFPVQDYNPERLDDWNLLKECTGDNPLEFELAYRLLGQENAYTTLGRKKPLLTELEDTIRSCYYESAEDAAEFHRKRTGWQPPAGDTTEDDSEFSMEQ